MNKLKYALLLILCIGLIGGLANVSAQSGERILVASKKPLKQSDVNKLIEFYEWAFETEFTGEQRERFREYTSEEFRRDAAGSRSTIDDIIGTLPKILAADNAVQQETRKNFLAAFLPEARKNSDENSQMLLGIYDAAHGGNKANVASSNSLQTENSDETDNSRVGNVGNISQLVGNWVWGRSGSSTYATSGSYMGSNGSRHTYQFNQNGTVQYTGIMNVMTGGCNMQVFKSAKGRASLNGSTLTINWSPAAFSRDDSCSPSKNYKKTLPAETETFQVNFKDSYGQKQLCLTGKDETCFSPGKQSSAKLY
jgi:hypothetical protein